jgi:hypothetical protein
MKYVTLHAAVVASLLVCDAAHAGDGDKAETLLRQGVQLRREHRDAEALEAFQRALAASGSPIARAQVALAEQALGEWVEAERDLKLALADSDEAWIARNRPALEDAGGEIARHLGSLTVTIEPKGAEPRLDGQRIAPGIETRLPVGPATLDVSAPGYMTQNRRLDIAPSADVRVSVTLAPLVAPPGEPVAASPPANAESLPTPGTTAERQRTPPIGVGPVALGAAGLIGVGAGIYFGLRATNETQQRDALCSAGTCSPGAFNYDGAARSAALESTVAVGAGVAALAAGAAWWAVDRGRADTKHDAAGAALSLGALGVVAAAGGAALGLLAIHDKQERDAQCPGGVCSPRAVSYDSEARTAANVSTVAFSLAAGLAATATTIWLVARPSGATEKGALSQVRLAMGPLGLELAGALK